MEEKEVMKEQTATGQGAGIQASAVEAAGKKLAEMNLLDDFLFSSMGRLRHRAGPEGQRRG